MTLGEPSGRGFLSNGSASLFLVCPCGTALFHSKVGTCASPPGSLPDCAAHGALVSWKACRACFMGFLWIPQGDPCFWHDSGLSVTHFLALSVPLCKRCMLSWDSLKGPSRLKSSHRYHSRSSLHFLDFLPSSPPLFLLCYSPLGISSSVPPVAPSWPPDPD